MTRKVSTWCGQGPAKPHLRRASYQSVNEDGNYIALGGKNFFPIPDCFSWDGIDLENLPANNSLSEYHVNLYIRSDQIRFIPVQHLGSCGYMAIAKALGLPRWKDVIEKLVRSKFFKGDVATPHDD